MKTLIVLSTILLTIMLLAACRAPLPAVSPPDRTTETIVPAQATRTPTPTPPPKLTREQMEPTPEEMAKMSKALQDSYKPPEKLYESSTRYVISGPTTKGMTITIAGKNIKLPDDVYVEHYVIQGIPSPGAKMPELPLYVLARGNSRISVAVGSGKIDLQRVAPGEEGAFNFLKEALK